MTLSNQLETAVEEETGTRRITKHGRARDLEVTTSRETSVGAGRQRDVVSFSQKVGKPVRVVVSVRTGDVADAIRKANASIQGLAPRVRTSTK